MREFAPQPYPLWAVIRTESGWKYTLVLGWTNSGSLVLLDGAGSRPTSEVRFYPDEVKAGLAVRELGYRANLQAVA